ncbi:hypothetical protein [Xanthomonas campestris]|uniref:hypothetical protein n=1 Tax=Xanthomonas campestris TaxID=339 RepID=UPI00355776A1
MGRLLDALRADSESVPVATLATLATFPVPDPEKSQSRKSRSGAKSENAHVVPVIRTHLLALAAGEGHPAKLVHGLSDADMLACHGYTDAELRGYLDALAAQGLMDTGTTPVEWGEPVTRTCESCGPVLLWADCPAVVKACPWCFRRKAGKPIARPPRRLVDEWAQQDAENTSGPPYFLPKEQAP